MTDAEVRAYLKSQIRLILVSNGPDGYSPFIGGRVTHPFLWPALRAKIAKIIITRTRDQWCEVFEGTHVCFAPVMSIKEAPKHPHIVARKTFIEVVRGGRAHPTSARSTLLADARADTWTTAPAGWRYTNDPEGAWL